MIVFRSILENRSCRIKMIGVNDVNRKNIVNGLMSKTADGFTLVELIVVLVILSVLSAVAVPTVLGFIDEGKAKECRSQVEALTADVISAKMAFEANGEIGEDGEVGREFGATQIEEYIAAAGAEGRCPVDNVLYEYKKDEHKIVCPKGHGEGVISGSGKFTVAVVEETDKRESPDEVLPPKNDEDNMPPKDDEDDSGEKSELGLVVPPVTVKEGGTGQLNPEGVGGSGKYTFQFESLNPDTVTVNESTGEITGVTPGPGKVKVTITDTETGKTVTKDVDVEVTPKLDLQVPENQTVGENQTKPLGDVKVEGGSGNYTITYESMTPGTVSVDATTGEITGGQAGDGGRVKVTVKDNETGETVTKEVPVKVTPKLDLQVPESQEVETGETKPLGDVKAEGGSGNYTITYESLTPGTVSVNETTGEITGGQAGADGRIKVTVRDNGTGETVTKEVPVTVTNPRTESSTEPETDSLLDLEVPSLTVKEGEEGKLEPKTTGGSGKYTYEYRNMDPEIVTVDEDGTVHGNKHGKAEVEVTVTDTETKEKKSVTVEVDIIKSGGLFNPKEMHFWADDAASVELHKEEGFKELMAGLPKGTWSLYSGDVSGSSFGNGEVKLHPTHYDENHCCTGPFVLKYVTDDGIEDYLTVTIGYPIHTVQKPNLTNSDRKIGEEVTCNTVLEPKHTTDGPVEWEVDPASTAEIELSYVDDKCTNVKIKMLSAGQFRIRAKVYRQREKDKGYVYSDWSDWDKVKYADLKQITIPSKIDIEEGALMDIAIQTEPNDVGPLTYDYQVNSEYFEMKDGKLLGKKSTGNQRYELRVTARQEGGQTAQAVCYVKVFPRKESETFIDGHQFKATSWEAFQAAVAANSNYQINHKDYANQESPIYYDDIKDAGENIIGRRLYVALGTDKNYKDNKRNVVAECNSFEMYNQKNKGEFVEIITPVQLAATVDWDDLGNDPTKYDEGAIVKVIHGSEVEYYIAISTSSNDRVLNNISSIKAWWPLDILS